MQAVREAFWSICDCPLPVVAAVQGSAMDTGLCLAASSDLIVCGQSARFGLPEISVGVMGGARHLARLVPSQVMRRVFLTADPMIGAELMAHGGVSAVVPDAELDGYALELAGRVARHSPATVRVAKRALNQIGPPRCTGPGAPTSASPAPLPGHNMQVIHCPVIPPRGRGRRIDRRPAVAFAPCLLRTSRAGGGELIRLGHPLLDAYLDLVTARARPNTLLATAFDLKVFFTVIDKDPADVVTSDVLAFIKAQREPRQGAKVVRIEDGEAGLSARTIKRRLASIAGLYEYLIIRGDTAVTQNPVPRGLALRRPGQRAARGVPLIRAPRTLPRVIDPADADAFLGALRTQRDRAMVEAMLLGGLRRCEALACGSEISAPASGGCPSPTARAVTSASSRSPRAFSPASAAT